MAEKRKDADFKVSDRRLFTADGELRSAVEEEERQEESGTAAKPSSSRASDNAEQAMPLHGDLPASRGPEDTPAPPAPAEQEAQNEAYKRSARDLDSRIELSGHSVKELEVSFERFMASLYMTAMLQLGLMHEQGGQPAVDLIGARQTIDTLGMLGEKTKGNLTPKEQGFLQNCLYELRMAYVEVTNALAKAPRSAGPGTGTNG
jgi:hypothetical protein